ncbi:MAG: V-type ATP synthase subunit I [Candidatus Woesearchaeota archaeon]
MLETERMSKIRVVTSKNNQKKVIKKFYDLKVLHIFEHKKTEELDIGTPQKDGEKIAELLVKVKSFLSNFKHSKDMNKIKTVNQQLQLKTIEREINTIGESLKNLRADISAIDSEISKKKELCGKLGLLNCLYLNLESYVGLRSISCLVGTLKSKDGLKKELENITNRFKIHISKNSVHDVIALFIDKKKEEEASKVLKNHGFSELNLEFIEDMEGLPLKYVNQLNDELQKLELRKNRLESNINKIKYENFKKMKIYENFLSIEADKAEAPLMFGETKDTIVITGWIPAKKVNSITKDIEKLTDSKVFIENIQAEKKEPRPIKMNNNMLIRPFEFFMRLYTIPSYKEIDPTTLIFITFPIFFGFMLGDVVYGIITLLLFILLKKLIPAGKDLLKSMMSCSYWTIIFGFIFGEYFGFEHVKHGTLSNIIEALKLPVHKVMLNNELIYEFPRLINRMHGEINVLGNNIHIVLVIGAIVGFIHINLSLLFGFINEYKGHGLKEAILAKFSWYILEAGLAIIVLKSMGIINLSSYVGVALIIISIIMIYLGEGVQGVVEIPAIFSNTLSYLRLGAVGLASVGLAVVINEKLALPFIEKGGISILIGVIILIIGHVINIALGILGPFLHSIRLHYVEFFNRFYKGGGKPYKPFGIDYKENI